METPVSLLMTEALIQVLQGLIQKGRLANVFTGPPVLEEGTQLPSAWIYTDADRSHTVERPLSSAVEAAKLIQLIGRIKDARDIDRLIELARQEVIRRSEWIAQYVYDEAGVNSQTGEKLVDDVEIDGVPIVARPAVDTKNGLALAALAVQYGYKEDTNP